MIDPSRFVYVAMNRHDELEDLVRDVLIEHGFNEKQILFQPPSKLAPKGDYFAVFMPNTKMFIINRVGKATTLSFGMSEGHMVNADEIVFSIDLSDRIRNQLNK